MEDNKKTPANDQNAGYNQEASEELRQSGGSESASPSRGGTTDMDDEALTVDRDPREQRGSGITTKNTVAGSDFDGQTA